MDLKFSSLDITGYEDQPVPNTYIATSNPANHLAILLYRTNFMDRSQAEQDRWISADVFAACNAGLSQRPYEKITLVGKSLGTIAMGHLLADRRFQGTTCIWLTPLLTVDWLRNRIEEIHPRSLFIIGTADQFYQPDIFRQLETVTNGSALVIEDANHALEIPGDIQKSVQALSQIVQALQEFIKKDS